MKKTLSILVLLAIFLLTSCSSGIPQQEYDRLLDKLEDLEDELEEAQDQLEAVTAQTPAPTPTPPPSPSPSPTPPPSPSPTGKTEQRFGYITDAYSDGDTNYIKINYIAYFTGDEAYEEAYDDSSDNPDLFYGPNTYYDGSHYVRDQSSKLRTWPLDENCIITYIGNESTKGFNPGRMIQDRVIWSVSVNNGIVISVLEVFTVPYYNFR